MFVGSVINSRKRMCVWEGGGHLMVGFMDHHIISSSCSDLFPIRPDSSFNNNLYIGIIYNVEYILNISHVILHHVNNRIIKNSKRCFFRSALPDIFSNIFTVQANKKSDKIYSSI